MTRDFVLGAGGFVGGSVAARLVEAGKNPVLVRPDPDLGGEYTALKERLSDFSALEPYADPGATYYYCISDMTPSNSAQRPSGFIEQNLTLFVRFLEWVSDMGGGHVVYTSSGGTVYGDAETYPTPETAPLRPKSFYGLVKATAEQYLSLFATQGRLTYTAARITNPFGPGQRLKRGQGLVAALLHRISTGEPIDIIGEGSTVRDYIHIDDVVDALLLCGQHEGLRNTEVNVATARGLSVMDVLRAVEAALGKKALLRHHPDRPGDVERSVLDISRIHEITGWSPRVTLESGLDAMIQQNVA